MSTLAIGTRLGPYEIVSAIGAGGMGEVYRARDTRLDRSVAVKVLPAAISANPEARARFEREARAISALNDPHICTLYDIGSEGDIAYLVMELLEGETLAEELARGKLPLDRALRHAMEMAAALDRAHRQGIVHRDLKPGNVMITRAGVKVLDFGLARLQTAPTAHDSETIVSPITAEGTILGTLQYMSPEQLEGKDADARADLFSFGCILYEMVTGQRAFTGSNQASIITAIMATDPAPLASLAPLAPPALERLVRKCLAKSREDRWQNAGDLATELRWIAEGPVAAAATPQRRRATYIACSIGAAAVAGIVITAIALRDPVVELRPIRLAVPLDQTRLAISSPLDRTIVLSRDGRMLAYIGSAGGQPQIWVRPLEASHATAIPHTENARSPFWSPDGKHIAFGSGSNLMRTNLRGDEISTICAVSPGSTMSGTWGTDDSIVFTELSDLERIYRVRAEGGNPTLIAMGKQPPNTRFCCPQLVGEPPRLLFTTITIPSEIALHATTTAGGVPRRIGEYPTRAEVIDDVLLYVRDGTLLAQPVGDDLAVRGKPTPLASGVLTLNYIGAADFTASPESIAFVASERDAHVYSMNRQGRILTALGPANATGPVRISDDGKRFAVAVLDDRTGAADIWLTDLARNTSAAVMVTHRTSETMPVWSPDGRTIAYTGYVDGPSHVFARPAAGGAESRITGLRRRQDVHDWSPDGRFLFFAENAATTKRNIWMVRAHPDSEPVEWLKTQFWEEMPRLSPNGKWVAFVSDMSGKPEVYVAPIHNSSEHYQISFGGGFEPVWRRDGGEIFFRLGETMYSARVRSTAPFEADRPQVLFSDSGAIWEGFDVTPDGETFLITRLLSGPPTNPIQVIVNWKSLLPKN